LIEPFLLVISLDERPCSIEIPGDGEDLVASVLHRFLHARRD